MATHQISPPPGFVLDTNPPPPGFVLDQEPPEGFVLDKEAQPISQELPQVPPAERFGSQAVHVPSEREKEILQDIVSTEGDPVGTTVVKAAKQVPPLLKASGGGLLQWWADTLKETKETAIPGRILLKLLDTDPEKVSELGREIFSENMQKAQERAPDVPEGSFKKYAADVVTASGVMAPMILAGMASGGSSTVALATMFPVVFGQEYGGRKEDASYEIASLEALAIAASEVITEKIPFSIILKRGSKPLKRLLKAAGAEGMEEYIQANFESLIDAGIIRRDMTMGEVWETLKSDQGKKLYQGLVGAGMGVTLAAPTAVLKGKPDIAPPEGFIEDQPEPPPGFTLDAQEPTIEELRAETERIANLVERQSEKFGWKESIEDIEELKKISKRIEKLEPETLSLPGQQYAGFVNTAAIEEPTTVPKEPIRRETIIKTLEKRLKMPIFTGRVKGRLGFFRPRVDEIRIKKRNDLEVTAHEVAHFVDYNNADIKRAYRKNPFRDELLGVSYDSKKVEEGFAEFVRLWATQEEVAAQRVPQFYEWWENWVKTNKTYGSAILEAKQGMKDWYAQGALNRLKSKIGKADFDVGQRIEAISDRFVDKRIAEVLDGLQGLKVAEKDLLGTIQDANSSPYKSMRLVSGARAVTKMILQEGTPGLDAKGNLYFTGESLKQVLEPVHNKLEDWAAYMVARRARELRRQRREKLITIDEEKAGLELGKDKDILEAYKRYREFNDRMMDFYESLGLVNSESRKAMEAANEEYIPFNRVIETFEGKAVKAGDPMKRLYGSDRNINDVIDNITTNIAVMTHRGLVNKAKLLAYDMVSTKKAGARYAVKIPKDSKKIKVPVEEVRRAFMDSLGLTKSMMDQIPVEMQQHFDWMFSGMEDIAQFWVHGQAPIGTNIDSVMRKGKLEYYEVADPLFFKAMNHYGHRDMALSLQILAGFKSVLTRGVTSMPDFMFVNLLRDTTMGYLFTKSGMKPLVGSIKGLVDRLSNDPAYKLMVLNGGGYSSTIHGETKAMRRNLEKIYKEAGVDYKNVLDSPAKTLRAWDEFNSAFEYGTRLNEAKRLIASGVSPKEAAFQFKDITTDFSMRGYSDVVRLFTTSVPFMNAGMQGLYRIARGFTTKDVVRNEKGEVVGQTNPVQLTAKALAAITIPSLLLLYLNYDDERYKALPDWIKDLHWVILLPEGTEKRTGFPEIYLIPKPFEVGAVFATIPERTMMAFMDRDGKKYIDSLGWIIAHQFRLEPWRIQAITPLVETEATNRNFAGNPIVPEELQGVEAFEQFRPWTSDTAKALGKATNTSPMKIEHWVRGYFGYLGMYALQGTDALVGPEYGEKPTPGLERYPVVRRLARQQPLRGTSYESDFYAMVQESRKIVKTFDKMMRELRPEAAEQYLGDKGKETARALGASLNKMVSQVSNARSKMRIISNDRELSGREKREQLNEIRSQLNEFFKQASKELSKEEFKKFRNMVKLRK